MISTMRMAVAATMTIEQARQNARNAACEFAPRARRRMHNAGSMIICGLIPGLGATRVRVGPPPGEQN